jgi:hypothetical protein
VGAVDERIEISAAVAIRGDSGFFFGALRWIEPKRLLIEVDAELEPGEEIDVRITLAPTSHTALLTARVTRPLVTAHGETPRYVVDILTMSVSERVLLDEWMRNVKTRGTFSRFETVVSSHRAAERNDSQANAEVRQALERMSRKPLSASGSSPVPPPQTDPFGVRSDLVTGAQLGAGRGAVRDALLSAIARGTAGRSAAGPSRPPAPAAQLPPASPPSSPPPEPSSARPGPGRVVATGGTSPGFAAPSVTRPGTDPAYATTLTNHAQWMEVRWFASANFDRDSRIHLLNFLLVLQRDAEPLPALEPLRIMLRHNELHLECAATVKAISPQSATYRLLLDPLQIERLRQWAADYGRK